MLTLLRVLDFISSVIHSFLCWWMLLMENSIGLNVSILTWYWQNLASALEHISMNMTVFCWQGLCPSTVWCRLTIKKREIDAKMPIMEDVHNPQEGSKTTKQALDTVRLAPCIIRKFLIFPVSSKTLGDNSWKTQCFTGAVSLFPTIPNWGQLSGWRFPASSKMNR